MQTYIASICEKQNLKHLASRAVSGGDINASFAVDTVEGRFFLKLNSASRYPNMFASEVEGLKVLSQGTKLKVPEVKATGLYEDTQYLFMEWFDKSSPGKDFWSSFAKELSSLHRITQHYFGWSSSNYIGSLLQPNELKETWADFYATQRIMPLVEELFNKSLLSEADVRGAEKLCLRLYDVFPTEPPALLHGDLWAGNFMAVRGKSDSPSIIMPCIFDPAVYFGHREMDLGMTLLFGGFDSTFYSAYDEIFPLEKNWRKRVPLTQLYPLLVHSLLFGVNYIVRSGDILKNWS